MTLSDNSYLPNRNRVIKKVLYPSVISVLVIVSIVTLLMGPMPWPRIWEGVIHRLDGSSTVWNPLLDERLPRLLVLLLTGASLAVSGAVMQSLFQNPLASPGVLGLSSGGSLMALLILISGWHILCPFAISVAAFGGCLVTLMIVYSLARSHGSLQIHLLILTGIAISTVLAALQGTLAYALRDHWELMQAVTEWEAGSTYDRTWQHAHMQLPLAIVGLGGCWKYRHEINILALGEDDARNLGVDVDKVRWRLFLCVSLLTGGAMAAVGVIPFFGLILPHVIRRLLGSNNAQLIPMCTLGGGIVIIAIDIALRLLSIHWLSIGNVSAVIGGLFFLTLLVQQMRRTTTMV